MFRSLEYSRGAIKKSISSLGVGERAWIDLSDPSSAELNRVNRLTGIYVKDMESVLGKEVLPRTVNRKGYSMAVLRALNPKKGYSHLGVFISNKAIVTVHKKKVLAVDDLLELVSGKEGKEFFSNGLAYIFFRITSYVTKRFHSELDKIEEVMKNPAKFGIPSWLFNRRKDIDTGEDLHLVSSDLDLREKFDIRRLRRIKCYIGSRHSRKDKGLKVKARGQRTRTTGRRKKKSVGVIRKK